MKKEPFFKRLLKAIGPGFITGAADDDPSGIGTYAQTGAMFGFQQLWVALFSYPFMTAIQEMCGRIGMQTGKGLSGVIKKHYSKKVLYFAVLLLLVANTINIGADLGAMAASIQLLAPIPFIPLLVLITIFVVALEVFVPYASYAKFLKWLALSLLAYVATAFVVTTEWGSVLHATLIPNISINKEYLLNIAALLGTTISPYLFFWQASEEVEEEVEKHQLREMGKGTPMIQTKDIEAMRLDTAFGMLFSNLIAFFIIVTAASTLHANGIQNIESAADAADALKPFAGDFAFLLFTLGIVGTGLLAVPVLAGSAGYAMAEALNWKEGLNKKFHQAKGFYAVIAAATVVGLFVNFLSISPMTMLYYTAVLNGVLAPPLMILILLIGNNREIMGPRANGSLSNFFGFSITAIMSIVAAMIVWSLISG